MVFWPSSLCRQQGISADYLSLLRSFVFSNKFSDNHPFAMLWSLKLEADMLGSRYVLNNIWIRSSNMLVLLSLSQINYLLAIDKTLSFSDCELGLGSLLFGDKNSFLISSGNLLRLLSHVEFNVAVRRKVWRNTTVSSVSSSSAADSSLSANMGNSALFWIERLSQGI